eukprot:1632594-Pleurochrysis_carterae.AAC.1
MLAASEAYFFSSIPVIVQQLQHVQAGVKPVGGLPFPLSHVLILYLCPTHTLFSSPIPTLAPTTTHTHAQRTKVRTYSVARSL